MKKKYDTVGGSATQKLRDLEEILERSKRDISNIGAFEEEEGDGNYVRMYRSEKLPKKELEELESEMDKRKSEFNKNNSFPRIKKLLRGK